MVKRALFKDFLNSGKLSGVILILCSVFSLVFANTAAGHAYIHFWHNEVVGKSVEFWINDGLMTVFFLLVGLEIEREFYVGELSDFKKSMLPVLAAVGGMLCPALIHAVFNFGTETQQGFGIPMATDIAFSLAVLSLFGNRVPLSLKIFLTALAIIDDLGAIMVIAIFYTHGFSLLHLGIALSIFVLMIVFNRLKIYITWLYLLFGMVMWYFMYKSGIHPTVTGVLLAFAIPFGNGDENSVSFKLQHRLHLFVGLLIVPLFALANTAIPLKGTGVKDLVTDNSLGIILGLLVGKPLGITLLSMAGIALGICHMPEDLKRRHLFWVACLAGIGFTMSIFITLLAFTDPTISNPSKVAIIIGSLLSGVVGYLGLNRSLGTGKAYTEHDHYAE